MNRQINSIEELDNSVKYELLTRLNSMKNHTKLCHGDYCPDNIIVTADAKGNIKEIDFDTCKNPTESHRRKARDFDSWIYE